MEYLKELRLSGNNQCRVIAVYEHTVHNQKSNCALEITMPIDRKTAKTIVQKFNAYEQNQQTIKELVEALEVSYVLMQRCGQFVKNAPIFEQIKQAITKAKAE